jgi:hypothetical protein
MPNIPTTPGADSSVALPRSTAKGIEILIAVLVLVVIVVHPMTSLGISLGWLGRLLGFGEKVVAKAPRLTLADVVIWLAGVLLLARILLRRNFRSLGSLPPAAVVLVLLAALSMLFAENKLTAIADVVQYVEYFIVFYLAAVAVLTTKERLRLAVLLWLAVGSAVILWALIHYQAASRDALHVSGPFLNRNVLGGYLAMLLPLSWGLMLDSRSVSICVQSLVLAVLALVVMLAGGPWIAALVGMGVITFARSPKLFPLFAVGILMLVLVLFPALPRDNVRVLATSLYPWDETQKDPTPDATPSPTGVPAPGATNLFDARRLNPRYVEWQAAMKFLTPGAHRELGMSRARHMRHLLLGVGIGNYQLNIGRYYGFLPKPNANTTEPDTNNLYLVLAMSVGIPAALAFLWLVGTFLHRAAASRRAASDDFLRGLCLGGAGALTSLLVTNVFTGTLVHGSGPAMILLFAFVSAGARLVERTSLDASGS